VVLLDVDFQMGDVLIFLDIASRYTWRDLINNLHRLDEALLHQSLTIHQTGLHVVAQSDALEEADDLEPAGVAKAIAFLRKHFEFVVIDGLRDFRETSLLVLDMADKIILTMTQDVPALKNANRCIGVLRQLGYDRSKLKLVVNRHTRGDKLDEDAIADALGVPVDAVVSNDFPTVIKAVNQGMLVVDMAPRSRVTKDIRGLVPLVRGEQAPPRQRGLFGRG
jgi:pilus assembly protein CpaE